MSRAAGFAVPLVHIHPLRCRAAFRSARSPSQRESVHIFGPSERHSRGADLSARSSHRQSAPIGDDAAPEDIARWARAEFLATVTGPERHFNLAKAGLLISLEEEAAVQAYRASTPQQGGASVHLLPDYRALREQLARCSWLHSTFSP